MAIEALKAVPCEDHEEFLRWISPADPIRYYPEFLRTEWDRPGRDVLYVRTDERSSPPPAQQC